MLRKLLLLCALSLAVTASAQVVLYEEHFTEGNMALEWHAGFTDSLGAGNSMEVDFMAGNPSGDGFIGKVGNSLSGGNVGLTYAGNIDLDDYMVTAWVYTTVTPAMGPYNSLVFRVNNELDSLLFYYQFDADFDDSQRLRFRKKMTDLPQVIRDWSAGEIPGGVPASSSWHKMSVRMEGNEFWLYWDDQLLPDCPLTDPYSPQITNGYFGVYIFNFSNPNDYTKVDDIVVTGEDSTGVNLPQAQLPARPDLLMAYPNPFNPEVTLSFTLEQASTVKLHVFDTRGRSVGTVLQNASLPAGLHRQSWNAAELPAGVYLVKLQTDRITALQKIVLLK